jgi:hypothetical protein
MRQLQEHPEMWMRVDSILESSSNPNSKFFALQARLLLPLRCSSAAKAVLQVWWRIELAPVRASLRLLLCAFFSLSSLLLSRLLCTLNRVLLRAALLGAETLAPHDSRQVLESVIKYRWLVLPQEQREGIKNFIATVVIKARQLLLLPCRSVGSRSRRCPATRLSSAETGRTSIS